MALARGSEGSWAWVTGGVKRGASPTLIWITWSRNYQCKIKLAVSWKSHSFGSTLLWFPNLAEGSNSCRNVVEKEGRGPVCGLLCRWGGEQGERWQKAGFISREEWGEPVPRGPTGLAGGASQMRVFCREGDSESLSRNGRHGRAIHLPFLKEGGA